MLSALLPLALMWDSAQTTNPTHATHSYLTEYAIKELKASYPEVVTYQKALIGGANMELHELSYTGGDRHGFKKAELEEMRKLHKGTNEGSDDTRGWWQDSLAAYAKGEKEKAFFLAGILLHNVQDMGVPAHANGVYHQGTAKEFDNFEALAFQKWSPDFAKVNKTDPQFAEAYKYYEFSAAWTREDAPDYKDRNAFSKLWLTAPQSQKGLVRMRQAKTAVVTKWALESLLKSFKG